MLQTDKIKNMAYIYNPANYSEEELIENFIVRLNEFNSIFQVIKNDDMKHPPQHFLIQGLRGNGKTTLLRRLYYEVKNDPQLSKNLIPVIFDEEEYGVRTLYKLWERIAENIEDNYSEFTGIYDEMMKYADKDDYEETAYKILKNKLNDKGMKLVLFFDNFGEVLGKFNEKEARRLREILMVENFIRIVGASSIMLESFYDYSKPFYEFFKIIQLNGLTKTEALEFLKKIAENHDKPEVVKMIETHPERVETLRVLTEGVPRTMLLLFEIFADNDNGNSFEDLEFVLDRVTPLYKHRMDDMSGIQQEIVDIIARNWDGIEVSTIAEKSRMDHLYLAGRDHRSTREVQVVCRRDLDAPHRHRRDRSHIDDETAATPLKRLLAAILMHETLPLQAEDVVRRREVDVESHRRIDRPTTH